MAASFKPVWYLLIVFVTLLVFGSWIREYEIARDRALSYYFISPETLDAVPGDEKLYNAITDLADMTARKSELLGEHFDSDRLRQFSRELEKEVARMRKEKRHRRHKKRSILQDLGNLFGGGKGSSSDGTQSSGGQEDNGLLFGITNALGLDSDGNSTGGLAGILQQGLSGIGSSLVGSLATPALFLGIGLGMGAETGLNITDMAHSEAVASGVASSFNAQPTGVNLIAQNLGSGFSAQIAPALGNLTGGGGGGLDVGALVFALAQGVGQGTASGLNLTQQSFQPSNGTDMNAIAGNLGLGVSMPIASSLNLSQLTSGTTGTTNDLLSQLPQIAAGAGKGLGEGVSEGLGFSTQNASSLSRRQINTQQIDIPGAVGDFTRGLSQAFLGSSNTSQLLQMVAPDSGSGLNFNLSAMLMPIAAGAGKGIGQGAAVGLNLQADAGLSVLPADANTSQTTETIVAEFSKSLVASFLANGTATTAFSDLTGGGASVTSSIQFASVAEGLARGLVEGSVNAISMVGGVQNLISGNYTLQQAMDLPDMPPSTFNDSVNGSATAFGRGLAGEGALLIARLFTNASTSGSKTKRELSVNQHVRPLLPPVTSVSRRQAQAPMPALAINSTMLSSLAQVGVNAITCQGFGGIASIGLGLQNSGAIKFNSSAGLDNQTLALLPKDPITVTSEGNTFQVTIQDMQVTINGLKIVPFAVLTALHVIFISLAFLYALPAYLALGAVWRLSILVGYPLDEQKNKRWRMRILLFLFVPSTIVGMILGIVGMGKAQHFGTGHGILGLLIFLIFIPTAVAAFLRLRSPEQLPPSSAYSLKGMINVCKSSNKIYAISAGLNQASLQFSMIAFIQGFSELRSISLCLVDAILTAPTVVGLVTFLFLIQSSSMAIVGFRVWLEQRIAKIGGIALPTSNSGGQGVRRTDTMATFGFDFNPTQRAVEEKVPAVTVHGRKNTADLLGREDSQIGWPVDVRKMGEDDIYNPAPGIDPFADPGTIPRQIGASVDLGRARANSDVVMDADGQSALAFKYFESSGSTRPGSVEREVEGAPQRWRSFSRPARDGREDGGLGDEEMNVQYARTPRADRVSRSR